MRTVRAVEVSKLAAIHGLERAPKLTPKQSQALAQTAEYVGLVIEPDARLTNRPYSWEDWFRCSARGKTGLRPTPATLLHP